MYVLKATQVPKSKLHQKLLQATQVIISLVREKERLEGIVSVLQSDQRDPQRRGKDRAHQPESGAGVQLASVEAEDHRDAGEKFKTGSPPNPVTDGNSGEQTRDARGSERSSKLHKQLDKETPSATFEGENHLYGGRDHLPTVESPSDIEVGNTQWRHDHLDVSLDSLKFVDSSEVEGEESARRAFHLLDKDALSSTLPSHAGEEESSRRVSAVEPLPRASTPEVLVVPEAEELAQSNPLQLKGSRIVPLPVDVPSRANPQWRSTARRRPQGQRRKVRNYNVKD